MQVFGLYGHIAKNRRRSRILIVGLFLLAYAASFGVALVVIGFSGKPVRDPVGEAGRLFLALSPVITVAVAAWVWIGYRANVGIIAFATGSAGLGRSEAPELYRMVETLCISRGMAVPKLMILETEALNAFASGVNEKQYTVTVTRGLLNALDHRELEAVIAHELTHIRNEDVKLMVVAVVIAGVISFVGEMAFRSLRHVRLSGNREKGGGIFILAGIAILAVSWVLALVLRFALSRSREYLADAGAVELTKNPDALISALLKIAGRADIEGVPSGVMDMCIENDPDDWGDIFSTHPSIAKRIQALVQTAGGRVPEDKPPAPPPVAERSSLTDEVERRGPWGTMPSAPR